MAAVFFFFFAVVFFVVVGSSRPDAFLEAAGFFAARAAARALRASDFAARAAASASRSPGFVTFMSRSTSAPQCQQRRLLGRRRSKPPQSGQGMSFSGGLFIAQSQSG